MEAYFAGDEVVLAWWRCRTAPVGFVHPDDDHDAIITTFLMNVGSPVVAASFVLEKFDLETESSSLELASVVVGGRADLSSSYRVEWGGAHDEATAAPEDRAEFRVEWGGAHDEATAAPFELAARRGRRGRQVCLGAAVLLGQAGLLGAAVGPHLG